MTNTMKKVSLTLLTLALLLPTWKHGFIKTVAASDARVATDSAPASALPAPADWRVTGPVGGDVRAIAIDKKNKNYLLVGTIDGQLYSSRDNGRSWTQLVGFREPGLYIEYIIIDPRDEQVLYVAAHRHKEAGGFYKSTDGGATWREPKELAGEAVHALAQAEQNPDVLVAGTNRGVYRSLDAGETWKMIPEGGFPELVNIDSLAIDPRTIDTIYAGTWYLPWKTTDGGKTWARVKQGMIDDSDVFAIEIDRRNPDHIIASACSGIYESKDGANNWKKVQGIPSTSRRTRAILQNPGSPNTIFAGTTEGFWRSLDNASTWSLMTPKQLEINAIAVHPEDANTIFIGTNNYGVMISRDNGKTFTGSNIGFSGRRAYKITADIEKPGRIYASTINTATGGGFFFISEDGGTNWRASLKGLPSRLIAYSLLQDERAPDTIYLGTNNGIFISKDRGESFEAVGAPSSETKTVGRTKRGAPVKRAQAVKPVVRPDETVKKAQAAMNAAGYNVGVADGVAGTRTITALRQFQAEKGVPQTGVFDAATFAALGLGGGSVTAANAASVQTAPVALNEIINSLTYTYDERDGQRGILAATNTGLYRTFNLAQGWEKLNYDANTDARTLTVSTTPQNTATIYVGTARSGVLVTRDSGKTWTQIPKEVIPHSVPVNIIRQDPNRSAYVYVGTTQTFYVSHDGGEKWMRRGAGLPLGTFSDILINPDSPDEVFVCRASERVTTSEAEGGVFRSTDAGLTWQRIDTALPSQRIWTLAFDSRNTNRLLVGSHSGGVYLAERAANGGTQATVSSAP